MYRSPVKSRQPFSPFASLSPHCPMRNVICELGKSRVVIDTNETSILIRSDKDDESIRIKTGNYRA